MIVLATSEQGSLLLNIDELHPTKIICLGASVRGIQPVSSNSVMNAINMFKDSFALFLRYYTIFCVFQQYSGHNDKAFGLRKHVL